MTLRVSIILVGVLFINAGWWLFGRRVDSAVDAQRDSYRRREDLISLFGVLLIVAGVMP